MAALKDLSLALTAWYQSMLEVANRPGSTESLRDDRFPELRVMMLTERVRDDDIRKEADALMAAETEVLLSMDPRAGVRERLEALSPTMSLYPGLQRSIGARIRELQK